MEKIVRFGSWNELKKAAREYAKLGCSFEVRGFEMMRENKAVVRDMDDDAERVPAKV